MQPFGANGLSIYRWSQQALDTPIGHPILPLLWQNFFALFLARVPTLSGFVSQKILYFYFLFFISNSILVIY